MKYILTLDEGTTSARAVLFDRALHAVGVDQKEFPQIYPTEGWVEHDPLTILNTQLAVIRGVLAKTGVSAEDIACIGIANQRETTVVWNRKTGKPVYNAIVWQCRRTAERCTELARRGLAETVRKKTGLPIDAYFSGTKIAWILDNVAGAREMAERGELAFGTVDTWLVWNLTGGAVHVTDRTNASRTMLYDIGKLAWDEELCRALGVPMNMLPEVRSSSEIYGYADINGVSVPISGIAGDQQAALFGQACFERGEAKNTYGTGCFLLMNTGDERVESRSGLITTVAASAKDAVRYALEGSVFVGGAVVQWIRDELGLVREASDSEYFASKVADTGGVYIIPAFTGLGAPYWDMYARGAIFGLTRGTKREHIIRAALESIAYQSADLLAAMEKDVGARIAALKVDGGASLNGFLMQYQADILNTEVLRAATTESTAMGAAALAGLAAGIISSEEEIRAGWKCGAAFTPDMDEAVRRAKMAGWHKAVGRAGDWVEHT